MDNVISFFSKMKNFLIYGSTTDTLSVINTGNTQYTGYLYIGSAKT